MKRYVQFQYPSSLFIGVSLLILCGLMLTACNDLFGTDGPGQTVHTQLLVTAPDRALPQDRPIEVKSRTQDTEYYVSHVELYAVQLPSGETDVLIRSDPAPFQQTTFTISQPFVPAEPGHYVIKVVGYNKLGQKMESNFLGFDVE
jgi:hypothetical protein